MRRVFALVAVAAVAATPLFAGQQTAARAVATPRPVAAAGAAGSGASPATAAPRLLPGTRTNVLSSIHGNALNSANGSMPNTLMRLRDARFGRVIDTVMTDKSGQFTFSGVDPGSYVVEMMSPANESVIAATPIINVNAGQMASTILKLPFRLPPFAGLLGPTTPSALAVSTAAAASGVLAESVAGAPATNRALPGQ